MEVKDNGDPANTDTITVSVNVIRNNAPVLSPPPVLPLPIDSNTQTGTVVHSFEAIDNDIVSIIHGYGKYQ